MLLQLILQLISIAIFLTLSINAQPTIQPHTNALDILKKHKLIQGQHIKLHLGCGQVKMKGYVNIDFPSTEHTVQTYSVADAFADLTTLSFPDNMIDEIRSHHVFEHFDRQEALAFLCKWHQWLKIGGILVIETPDYERASRLVLENKLSYVAKQAVMRHIFGSHEAKWAIHCDGWYKEKFEHVLKALGYEIINIELSAGHGGLTPNITITAQKKSNIALDHLTKQSKKILQESLVAADETQMYAVWCKDLDKTIRKMSHE